MRQQQRRRGRPNDLTNTGPPSGYIKPRPGDVHDRRSQDKLLNAKLAAVEIDDPLALNFGDKIIVFRSTRNDVLADMRAREQITDCDYDAGRYWQNAYEKSQIGSIKAIDTTREAVDGGRPPEALTDRQRKGADDVDAARLGLGPVGNELVHDVLAHGLSIRLAARRRGLVSQHHRRVIGLQFRVCLQTLAVLFGMATVVKV